MLSRSKCQSSIISVDAYDFEDEDEDNPIQDPNQDFSDDSGLEEENKDSIIDSESPSLKINNEEDEDLIDSEGSDSTQMEKEENLSEWTTLFLKNLHAQWVHHSASVIMGHYLVVLIHEQHNVDDFIFSRKYEPTTVLVVDLRENRVQTAKIKGDRINVENKSYTLTKYGENQLIRYGGQSVDKSTSLTRITITSFERLTILLEINI